MKEIRYIMVTMGVILMVAAFACFTIATFAIGTEIGGTSYIAAIITLIAGSILVLFAPNTTN